MIPSRETLEAFGGNLKILGSGSFARVYEQEDGSIIKFAKMDGTSYYLEWLHRRMMKYGPDHPKMAHMPQVEAYGRILLPLSFDYAHKERKSGYWAVMPRYQEPHFQYGDSTGDWKKAQEQIKDTVAGLEEVFGPSEFGDSFVNDMHQGNVMWDQRREQYVLTDPSSSSNNFGGSKTEDYEFPVSSKVRALMLIPGEVAHRVPRHKKASDAWREELKRGPVWFWGRELPVWQRATQAKQVVTALEARAALAKMA